jgi:superoxide reductase
MNTFVCKKCGYVAFNAAPEKCPACGAPKEQFREDNNAIKKPVDQANLNDLEKKHIPVIDINKQCGLAGPGCLDANIKVGSVLHVMESKHFIMYIDVYLDYNFIARYFLTPDRLNPVLGIHLKTGQGRLTVLEYCNLHGRWVAEADI